MVKVICYIMTALCSILAVASLLDILDVISIGMEMRNVVVGAVGAVCSFYLGRNISHFERDEKDRGGPGVLK